MAKKKTGVIEEAAQAELPTADLPVTIEPTSTVILGLFDLGATLAEVEAQTATFRTRQQAILSDLATKTGMDLADLLFLFGLPAS